MEHHPAHSMELLYSSYPNYTKASLEYALLEGQRRRRVSGAEWITERIAGDEVLPSQNYRAVKESVNEFDGTEEKTMLTLATAVE